MDTRILQTFAVLAAVGALLVATGTAAAQERPALVPTVEFSAGTFLFPDDGVVKEGFAGGGARFYLSRRISVGPEIAYVVGHDHNHLTLTGNMTVDLVGPLPDGSSRMATPFVVVGGGLFQSRGRTFSRGTLTYNEGAFTAGGGVRGRINDRVYAGVEGRIGWELHLRVNGFVGVRLGR